MLINYLKYRNCILTVFLFSCFGISAKPSLNCIGLTKIEGIINLKDSTELNVGIYQNTLVELDPAFFFNWKNLNHETNFKIAFTIDSPQIIEFYLGDNQRYKFYILPGSTNKIIINENEITFIGPTEQENNILLKLNLNKAPLKSPKFSNRKNIENSLAELNLYCDSLEKNITKSVLGKDFVKYIDAELFGYRYFWKSNLLYPFEKDTLAIDTLSEFMQENVRSLFSFKIINESRSRYYNNSASSYYHSILNLNLSTDEEKNLGLYTIGCINTIHEKFNNSTNIESILITATINGTIYKAKDKFELELGEYLYDYYIKRIDHEESAFKVIKISLEEKRVRLNLNKIFNYTLLNSADKFDSISKYTLSKINIINFWASWCQPCVQKLPALNSIAISKNVSLINVNIWSNKLSWLKIVTSKNDIGQIQLFADKELSNKIVQECSITQFPLYIIVSEELKVLKIFDTYPSLIDYLSLL